MENILMSEYPQILQPVLKDFEYTFAIQHQDKNGKFMTDYSIINRIQTDSYSQHTIHFRTCLFVNEIAQAFGDFKAVIVQVYSDKIICQYNSEKMIILMDDYSPTLFSEVISQLIC
jgi:hypothetical protein